MKHSLLKFLFLTILCGAQLCTYAQSNQVEAKAAYLLAEEKFAEGDYESTLDYLDRSAKSLGKANSKLLYLQIQAELELYKKDKSYYDRVVESISAFQNAPDVKNFAEDKVIEVAKLKMQLAEERSSELAKARNEKEEKERYANTFRDFSFENWPIGVLFSELKISHQDSAIFQRKLKSQKIYNLINGKYVKSQNVENSRGAAFSEHEVEWGNTILSIITRDDTIKGYKKIIYNQYVAEGSTIWQTISNTDKTLDIARNDIQQIVKKLSADLGFEPELSKNGNTYQWTRNGKTIKLYDRSVAITAKRWHSRAVLEISEL